MYKCNEGYTLTGNNIRVCKENGQWFPEKPECQGTAQIFYFVNLLIEFDIFFEGVQCTAFKKPDNSDINIIVDNSYGDFIEGVSRFDVGTQIEIVCDNNANLTGENIITCQENGNEIAFI